MEASIKKWYMNTFPNDELCCELSDSATFTHLLTALNNGQDVYDVIGVGDSIVRERVFGRLSEIMNVDYNFIYKKWLGRFCMDEKYVKLEDVQKLLSLIKMRDNFNDWTTSYKNYDAMVEELIKLLEKNAVNIR